jgi:ferritin
MLTKKVEAILNKQVEKEGYSSNLYLAMASWAEVNGFKGISEWLYAQAEEERMHMLKFIAYLNERDGKAIIPAFEKPPVEQKSVLEMFKAVLKHERFISASINEIVALSISEKDYTTQHFVQWFVNEQIEEEANVKTILDKLKLTGESNLYLFDRDIMSLRTPATGEAEPA